MLCGGVEIKIIFYRDKKSQEIYRHHIEPNHEGFELEKAMAEYNANETNTSVVIAVEADEFMEYLFTKAEEKRLFPKKMIEEAIEYLDFAKDCILGLETKEVD